MRQLGLAHATLVLIISFLAPGKMRVAPKPGTKGPKTESEEVGYGANWYEQTRQAGGVTGQKGRTVREELGESPGRETKQRCRPRAWLWVFKQAHKLLPLASL